MQPVDELSEHRYGKAFLDALSEFLATRGGDRWLELHGSGPRSRMARFEAATLPEIERHCGPVAGKRVLDFGCGTGTITPSLADRASQVYAFDISEPAIALTRMRLADHAIASVKVLCAQSYSDVAEPAGQFDLVLMHAVFEHVPLSIPGLRAMVLGEAFDAVSPGGHLVICESPNRLWPRDIYCTGLWGIPWTRGGSRWAYERAVHKGRHADPEGRGPISLEERGAWGFTYWALRRYLHDRPHEILNAQAGHDRWVRYGRRLSARRRLFETAAYYGLTRTAKVPVVALAPMLSPVVIAKPARAPR